MLTETQLRQMLPLLPLPKLQQYLPHLNDALRAFEINTALRTAAFVAQTSHESAQFTRMLESLNYTKAAGLMATWPRRFPTEASALPYVRNEQKLANFVYANRMGNGDSASGDGFRYRGRGVIQLTGRDAYRRAGEVLGLDLVGQPELVQTPEVAFQVAGLYWKSNGLNELADVPDLKSITQRINGGQTGQAERVKYFELARRVLATGFVADAPATRGTRSSAAAVRSLPAGMKPLRRGWQDTAEPEESMATAALAPAAVKAASAKKAVVKKAVVKKAPPNGAPVKKTPAKSAPGKKVVAKKVVGNKVTAKKAAAKKTAAKKTALKKVASKRAVARSPSRLAKS